MSDKHNKKINQWENDIDDLLNSLDPKDYPDLFKILQEEKEVFDEEKRYDEKTERFLKSVFDSVKE